MANEGASGHRRFPRPRTGFGGYCTTFAALLVVALVGVVPVGALVFDLPVQGLVLGTAVTYLALTTFLGRSFEGFVAALFVVVGFNVTAHLDVAQIDGLAIRLADVLVICTLGLVLRRRTGFAPLRRRGPQLVVGSLSLFVLWTFLSAAVGNGPSSTAAIEYAIEHLRYLALLVTTALVVAEVGPGRVLSPLAIGMAGALAFAVDDVFGGHAGYLINFGPFEELIRGVWPTTSITALPMEATVIYDGAVGHSRILVGIGLVFVPVVLAAATLSRRHVFVAATILLGVVNVVASGSHAAILALYAGLATNVVYLVYLGLERMGMDRARDLVVPVSAILGAILAVAILVATATGLDELLFVRTNNMDVRLQQYATAVDLALRYPLVGIGGGWSFYLLVGEGIHNIFLANLAATGVPGFLAFLASQVGVAWLCLRNLRDRPADERWLWVGIVGALLAFYAYTFWVVAHRWVPLNAAYWVLAGIVVGATATSTGDSPGFARRLQGWLSRRRGDEENDA